MSSVIREPRDFWSGGIFVVFGLAAIFILVRGAGLAVSIVLLVMVSACASGRFKVLPYLAVAIGMIVFGLVLGLVGTDVNSGTARYTFDLPQLADGINFVVVAMGMFGLGEIVSNLEHAENRSVVMNDGGLRPVRLRLPQAGDGTGADAAGLHHRADDGRVPAPCVAAVEE